MKSMTFAFAVALTVALAAAPALARIPYFAAKCPTDISVETDRAGRAYLNGKRATVRTLNPNAYEIVGRGVIIDVTKGASGLIASYTGPHRANGICEIVEQETVSVPADPKPAVAAAPAGGALNDAPRRDQNACVRAVKRKTHDPQAVVLESVTSEANNMVKVGVGAAKAPWKCLVNRGHVVEVMSLTDEGAL